jgi:hypothetical protein
LVETLFGIIPASAYVVFGGGYIASTSFSVESTLCKTVLSGVRLLGSGSSGSLGGRSDLLESGFVGGLLAANGAFSLTLLFADATAVE